MKLNWILLARDLLAYNSILHRVIKSSSVLHIHENLPFLFDWLNPKVSRKGLSVECANPLSLGREKQGESTE